MNQPKTQPTKPSQVSAGALRAALKIYEATPPITGNKGYRGPTCGEVATIIDRETGMAELLEAAKKFSGEALAAIVLLREAETPLDRSNAIVGFDVDRHKFEQAIAKCESGTGRE